MNTKKITEINTVLSMNDSDYVYIKTDEDIKMIKKSDFNDGYRKASDQDVIDSKLKSDFSEEIQQYLTQAQNAMQSSVYDTNGKATDIYEYADTSSSDAQYEAIKSIKDTYDPNRKETDIYDYVDKKSYVIKMVDELPESGDELTFYLVPNTSKTGYDKYWWIKDEDGNSGWDSFGSSNTLIVTSLDGFTPDEKTDYILKTGAGYLFYKYIDSEWHIIAGSLAVIADSLPETSNGNEFTDYYIKSTTTENTYFHYRFINDSFCIVGGDSYTKAEIDDLFKTVNENITKTQGDIKTNSTNITTLNESIISLQQDVDNIDTDAYQYYHTVTQSEDGNWVLTLYQTHGEDEEIVSQTTLPSTGGSGGGTTTTNVLTIERITNTPLVLTTTDSATIEFNFSGLDSDGDAVDCTYVWKSNGVTLRTGTIAQGKNSFDFTDYCSVGTQKFTITVQDEIGTTVQKTWSVQVVDVRLESSFNDRYTQEANKTVNFTYTPYGAIEKVVHFKLDGIEIDTFTTKLSGVIQSYTIPAQTHGTHFLEVYITANINNITIETPHIYKDIIWYDETSEDPVVGCIYRNDYYGDVESVQYSTLSIPYVVYDPNTNDPKVSITVDGELYSSLTLTQAYNVFSFKSDVVAKHTVVITCRTKSVTIVVDVSDLGIDISPVTGGLEFDFNPTGYNNSSSDRLWKSSDESVAMTVSDNFDWSSGGYQIDDDGNQYFMVKAGTRAYINYNLFEGSVSSNASINGLEFKVIFEVDNVQNTDATWLSCLGDDSVGIQLKAHEGYLTTSASDLSKAGTYLYMPYSEEDTIELEFNINSLDQDDSEATSYIMSYEDGVGLKAMIYDSTHRMYQYNAVPITIGSDECDVRIYRMKTYSNALTDSNILTNFIADSRDSDTMISRYNRNQIYDENNTLTPESVAEACPDLKIIKIEAPYFTNDKKDFVKNTIVQCIHKNGDSVYDNWIFSNGYHAGQGTTSNEYGYAARNLDLIFNCDGVNPPNDKISADASYVSQLKLGNGVTYTGDQDECKITLTRTSVPTNWLNIKVNVASSENANNALLQKRYNDFITYTSLGQKRDSRVKNDMEFVNCVVFIKETNTDNTTHREYQDNDWHFYAIGNIGDSKKTDYSRAYDQDDMNEFTVEISDNTCNNATFQTGVYLDENGNRTIEKVGDTTTHTYLYPITASEWNSTNARYKFLYDDEFEGTDEDTGLGSFELRYGCKGDFKDGKLIVKSDTNKAQLKLNADVFRAFYRWVITSTDEEFVAQLNEWCIEKSVLYWYLFTLHFTMIDNRAKNTFWHFAKTGEHVKVTNPVNELIHIYEEIDESSDTGYSKTTDTSIQSEKTYYTQYAFDLLDYDNDTAIGINNSGELTMTYGKEDIDYKIDGDESSGWLFNAAESTIWCRLRDLFGTELTNMYQTISPSCWSADNIINEFDNWQSMFPEELWRLHYERLYIRTYQGGGLNGGKAAEPTQRFLKNMMQGRKKYQRRQFLRNQEDYMGTKYLTSTIRADQIMFRCNTPTGSNIAVSPDYTLHVTPYADMYLSVMFGNTSPKQIRAKANTEYEITCPMSTMSDTAVLIYNASKIQALNDLSACYIHDNDFSKASKLKRLIIGNNTEGYSNTFLESINLGSNALLEELDLRNCTNLGGSINLSGAYNLKTLYAEGTAITGVVFATYGKIQSAHLPSTIKTLIMKYLNNLTDLSVASYDNLETLTIYGGIVNMLNIVNETIDTVQTLDLADVNWELATTTLLNSILKINSSSMSGAVNITGSIRQQEIVSYSNAWKDLAVKYNSDLVIAQYLIKYVNYDGTVLYQEYVDRGGTPIDPVELGYIVAPTRPSDTQYIYTFDSWDDLSTALTDRTVNAIYSIKLREYQVRWFAQTGTEPLKVASIGYGEEAVYDGDIPTKTDEESVYIYNIFKGWNKSTGYITEDIDVYALWDRKALPEEGTLLKDMSVAEIYGVTKADKTTEYFEDKDYVDVTLGHDFDFTNVESKTLVELDVAYNITNGQDVGLTLDGNTAIDTGIKLFAEDSPSFTLVVEYDCKRSLTYPSSRNVDNDFNTIISCFENKSELVNNYYDSNGFRLGDEAFYYDYGSSAGDTNYYSGCDICYSDDSKITRYTTSSQSYSNTAYQKVTWGQRKHVRLCGSNVYSRNLAVIRHIKGSSDLHVYCYNPSTESQNLSSTSNVKYQKLTRSVFNYTDATLILGALRSNDGESYIKYGTGYIYWCKIWYNDLGDANCRKLASWIHEPLRMQYYGNKIYELSDGSGYCSASFISQNMPSRLLYTGYNTGGWYYSEMRKTLNNIFYSGAVPDCWKSIIKEIKFNSYYENNENSYMVSYDKIYLPSFYEISGSTSYQYGKENNCRISWLNGVFRNEIRRRCFIYDNNYTYYSTSLDPTIQNDVKHGDIWYDSTNNYYFVYLDKEYVDKYNITTTGYIYNGYLYKYKGVDSNSTATGCWMIVGYSSVYYSAILSRTNCQASSTYYRSYYYKTLSSYYSDTSDTYGYFTYTPCWSI